MARFVLSLDQGTTSSRAILFDHDGTVAAQAQQEVTQIYPDSGWVEHDPADILASQLQVAARVLQQAGAAPSDIAALGITNQRETAIVWDRETGEPIYNAIVWQDRRTAAACDTLRHSGAEAMVRGKSGLLIDPYFSATKIGWMLDHVQGARSRAEQGKLAFGTVDSWLVWHLTGGRRHVTDRTNASRTMLYDVVRDQWDEELLRVFGIPESLLPEIVWSSGQVGAATTQDLAGIPIAGIAGDQQSALFGQLCTNPGDAKNTYGTGCFLLQNIGAEFRLSQARMITTIACTADRTLCYALEGSVFVGGAVVQWLRDKMQFFASAPDIEQIASGADSAHLVFVPAFTGLGAPYWDPHAAGLIIGLQRSTEIGHIARAAIDSIAFQVADVVRAMESDTNQAFTLLKADGGAASNDMLMQFQADLLGLPVERSAIAETTALGAAYLAGLASGFWAGMDEIAGLRRPGQVFLPRMDRSDAQARSARWQDAVRRSKSWFGGNP